MGVYALHRLPRALPSSLALGAAIAALAVPGPARAAVACANVADGTVPPSPSPGNPCWVELDPYPFGSDGNPVDTSTPRCKPNIDGDVLGCYLTVTSFAFRAWNRGLAATSDLNSPSPNTTAFGVWLYNGVRWFPDPTFPGKRTCKGSTVLWAGKRDYWLIGPDLSNSWPSLCRFDGSRFEWDPLPVPAQTLARATPPGGSLPSPGAVTAGACSAWDDCWFFGTYGSIIHWDGKQLTDASPDPALPWLSPAFTSAVIRQDENGVFFGLAGGASSSSTQGKPLPPAPDGSPPSQVYTLTPQSATPIPFPLPDIPQPNDPYRTDVVALDLDGFATGWLAGNPAGMRTFDSPVPPGRPAPGTPEPSPLVPIAALGPNPSCQAPPLDAFQFTKQQTTLDAYLWSSLGAVPGTGEAFAGGQFRPGLDGKPHPRNDDLQPEPSLEHVGCGIPSTLTRFRVPDPTEGGPNPPLVPADRLGATNAVAASAVNDAWAATTRGVLVNPNQTFVTQQPRLYQFTDGQAPQAPAGDDDEDRPPELQLDPPIIVFVPLPPPPVVVTTTTTTVTTSTSSTKVVHLGSPIDKVRTKLHKLDLVVEFRVKRRVTLGVLALRKRTVVARTRLADLRTGTRRLVLHLDPKRWPTALRFYTDTPTIRLLDPGTSLRGTVVLKATAKAIRGRKIVSVTFQQAASGTGQWVTIGTDTELPFTADFDTTKVANGSYDLQAIATDSAGRVAVSTSLVNNIVSN